MIKRIRLLTLKVEAKIKTSRSLQVKDIYGKIKNWRKTTEQIMREVDEDLDIFRR